MSTVFETFTPTVMATAISTIISRANIFDLWAEGETGTFLDFIDPYVFSDTAGTTPAAVGEGIANADDRSPNDADSVQATSTARPRLARVPRGGRRNLALYSEEFDNAYWPKTEATISANAINAPDGTLTADKIIPSTNSSSTHRVFKDFGTALPTGDKGTSFYLKSGGYDYAVLLLNDVNNMIAVDLAAGAITFQGISISTASLTAVGDGWYRAYVRSTTPAYHRFGGVYPQPSPVTTNTLPTYTGDGTSGIYIWGAQLELGTTATPYQKVTTEYDITETGVDSIYHAVYDGVDDISPVTLPTITGGTVALVGLSGIWIEEDWDYAGGTLNIGPTTVAGLPAGILEVVGGLCAVIVNSRAWTAAERAAVIAWGKARGAPGVFSLGPELVTNGTFDSDTAWTKNAAWSISGGVATVTSGGNQRISQNIGLLDGSLYLGLIDVTAYTNGNLLLEAGDVVGDGWASPTINAVGSYKCLLRASVAGTGSIRVAAFSSASASVDNISLRKLELIP